jgi:flagellar protein FlaJ
MPPALSFSVSYMKIGMPFWLLILFRERQILIMPSLYKIYKKLSMVFFGWAAERCMKSFKKLEPHLKNANINILLRTWIAVIFFTTFIIGVASFFAVYFVLTSLIKLPVVIHVFCMVFFPIMSSAITFVFFYIYPIQKEDSLEKNIDNNLPFATTHMAAISSSGIPPEFMFELLTGFKEYGEISNEAKMIMRNIKTFGMSSADAMKNVADRTPSKNFRDLLLGIVSTIETGGNLDEYLKVMSDKALFEYRIKREKYLKTLSTYADLYTALLVAAPLMMLSLLSTMLIIGGRVLGLEIPDAIALMTFLVLPIMNVSYLAFLQITYPGV